MQAGNKSAIDTPDESYVHQDQVGQSLMPDLILLLPICGSGKGDTPFMSFSADSLWSTARMMTREICHGNVSQYNDVTIDEGRHSSTQEPSVH